MDSWDHPPPPPPPPTPEQKLFQHRYNLDWWDTNLKQNEAQVTGAESTHKGVD